ncbi:MAG: DUF4410 domain-containing protein [Verrucomicrobiota bacterium]
MKLALAALPKWPGTALCASLLLALAGCGTINTAPNKSSVAQLSPDPRVIIVAPFDIETGKWLVGNDRYGSELKRFKERFQSRFQEELIERLMKIAPTKAKWKDDQPNEGWMVSGDFITVYQGSRFLRTAIGFGAGETKLQTRVYVYDLTKSKTEYILSFDTGVQESPDGTGSGSGQMPGAIVGNVYNASTNFGAGLTLDATRTCREIRDILMTYK